GAAIGLVHSLFVLAAALPVLPALHPRMASEQSGPTPTRQLEPPGFLALNYGYRTPLSVVLAHLLYGAILGLFCRLAVAEPEAEHALTLKWRQVSVLATDSGPRSVLPA